MNVIIKDISGETLPGATIFESDSAGNIINDGFVIISDDNGQASIPEGLQYITLTYVGYKKQTIPGDNIPAVITMQTDINQLAAVTITGTPTTDYLPWIIGGIALLLLITYLFTLKSKP